MTEKEASDLTRMRSLTSDKTSPPSFAELRAARDEAQRNFESISADVEAADETFNEEINALRKQFEAKYADLLALQQRAHRIALRAEDDLRAAIIDEYNRTGNKQIDKNLKLGVRVNRKIKINDADAALVWSKANAPMLVREVIDEKAFSKIIETLPELPEFVEETKTPIVVIGEL